MPALCGELLVAELRAPNDGARLAERSRSDNGIGPDARFISEQGTELRDSSAMQTGLKANHDFLGGSFIAVVANDAPGFEVDPFAKD